MSEYINNREYRQKALKELVTDIHNGKSVDDIKSEQGLIMEGMPVEEIQRLCDVHAAVFKGSIEEMQIPQKPEETQKRLESHGQEIISN